MGKSPNYIPHKKDFKSLSSIHLEMHFPALYQKTQIKQ